MPKHDKVTKLFRSFASCKTNLYVYYIYISFTSVNIITPVRDILRQVLRKSE